MRRIATINYKRKLFEESQPVESMIVRLRKYLHLACAGCSSVFVFSAKREEGKKTLEGEHVTMTNRGSYLAGSLCSASFLLQGPRSSSHKPTAADVLYCHDIRRVGHLRAGERDG